MMVLLACCTVVQAQNAPVPSNKPPHYPAWWFKREVIKRINPAIINPVWPTDYHQADDYAVINQGQLKWLMLQAASELPGNGGAEVQEYLDGFRVTNLSLQPGVAATQSSTLGAPASRAIDGNTDGNFYNNSVSHTGADVDPWWQVDLGSLRTIRNIEIWNRTDCCGDRNRNFYVFIANDDMSGRSLGELLSDSAVWKSEKITTRPNPNLLLPVEAKTSRYVMVRIQGTEYLSLAEVKVNGNLLGYRTGVDDFAAVNLGQLKALSLPYYSHLVSLDLVANYPWSSSAGLADDFAVANIGQAKNLFSFSFDDTDGDGVNDILEQRYGRLPSDPSDVNADSDDDGASDVSELYIKTNPTKKDNAMLELTVFGVTAP